MKKLIAYLKTSSFRKTVLMAVVTVIGIVLIAFFSLSYYTDHGSGVPVPSVKGLSIDQAVNKLEEQGFDFHVDTVYVGDKAPGTIIEQDPDAGTLVKEGRVIYLTMVTMQAPPVALPDIEQKPYINALSALSNAGLKIGDTTYTPDIARDVVLEVKLAGQVVRPGMKIPKGSRIDLVLGDGNGANEQDIPELIGQDLDAARFAVKGLGLTIGIITYQGTITDSTNLKVVDQFPKRTDSTTTTSIGTRINLTVSQGSVDGN
ncbi:PASTA domain-containing protein [Mucilaginibacter auburnensis]|uniref:Beta-lactam-binding protein with PASTA domain n=1 Tax=Mucilaginibacter auburnensis TaxID=1457233 RepID=A0A2H9VL10_9SPHI|nr:PASTA domain-containing protein [Mucilaginibacter auburnensis]PJJ79013.1 beta-lactam-binding protein with PASTA domain [Mucilaginibacter auburnensis]